VTDKDIADTEIALEKIHVRRQGGSSEYKFPVYFNIVAKNMTTDGGWVPYVFLLVCVWRVQLRVLFHSQKQIDDQMTLLNEKYVGTGISFELVNVTRIISRYWHETIDTDTYALSPLYN